MKPDKLDLLCNRQQEVPKPAVESIAEECSVCERPVWVALTSIQAMEQGHPGVPFQFICTVCWPSVHKGEEIEYMPLSKDQEEEFKKKLGYVPTLDQLKAMMKRRGLA